jgi:hypothetical protein
MFAGGFWLECHRYQKLEKLAAAASTGPTTGGD